MLNDESTLHLNFKFFCFFVVRKIEKMNSRERKRTLSSTTATSTTDDSSSDESSTTDASPDKKPFRPSESSDGGGGGNDDAGGESSDFNSQLNKYSSFAQKMMAQMGYKKGKGLGKNETGRVEIIEASKQRGRRGLGLTLKGLEGKSDATWSDEEEVMIRQDPEWIPENTLSAPLLTDLYEWTSMGGCKKTIDDEYNFCEPDILRGILASKSIFDHLGKDEFLKARTRANPYETIRGSIFQNRAAMKMAEMDASFDFIFTSHKDYDAKDPSNLLYFADICAGPGGFSEYVLWKRKWHSKGFGFTLKAEWANDFKLEDFKAGTPETFDCHYGVGGYQGDGDIFRDDNLVEFSKYVKENTDNQGVHFVMADGGFSVEGQENIQEILSKQLYLCQFTCALSLLRVGGHFVCKLFDLFTPFSVGLVYLMYRAFKRICIFKPVTSRPANSERYIVCEEMRDDAKSIHDYLFESNTKLNNLKGSDVDLSELVPVDIMKDDEIFFDYIKRSNNTIGARQILALKKLATYVQNVTLIGPNQGEVRKQCLEAWQVPLSARSSVTKSDPSKQFEKIVNHSMLKAVATKVASLTENTLSAIKSIHDYKFAFCGGERVILFSLGRYAVFQWNPQQNTQPHWKRIQLELPRFTILDAELVNELKGDARGQRKVLAVHILDVVQLGDDFLGDKPLSERIKHTQTFVKALSRPCRTDVVVLRMKEYYPLNELDSVLSELQTKLMKPRMEPRLTCAIDKEKYFVPTGLYLIRRIKEPWHLQFSRTSKKYYFYNPKTTQSTFEGVKESIADIKYCLESRKFWKWMDTGIPGFSVLDSQSMTRDKFVDFLNTKQ